MFILSAIIFGCLAAIFAIKAIMCVVEHFK